ncbi:MAG: sulfite exporter TauE/SafE family protein [Candidatus Omnitrophica bacterium]|nr:sulfite exporter TauE/SafE family protein [Candidatus Omnitrophota bacterium]
MVQLLYVILGVVAGVLSGMLGIGGGLILIPGLIYIFGLTQLQAQGTTLALMVPPIGLLAAMRYYQNGNVKLGMAGFICAGFFVGGLLGANLVQHFPEPLVRKIFALFLLFVSLRMLLAK